MTCLFNTVLLRVRQKSTLVQRLLVLTAEAEGVLVVFNSLQCNPSTVNSDKYITLTLTTTTLTLTPTTTNLTLTRFSAKSNNQSKESPSCQSEAKKAVLAPTILRKKDLRERFPWVSDIASGEFQRELKSPASNEDAQGHPLHQQ